jgi:DNA-binding XRE family transcriptional regulator
MRSVCYEFITIETRLRLSVKLIFFKAMPKTKTPANLVGPQVKRRREELQLTQEQLAAQLQVNGLDISRSTLGQIEVRLRCVIDSELIVLAKTLKVTTDELFPVSSRKRK